MTLTTDVGKILTKLHQVQPSGNIKLITGIRIAHVSEALRSTECCFCKIQCFLPARLFILLTVD